ncbi:YbdK family carboxylate-amine ligase [Solirubrobacter sp. CPCC 204708]|uniref:Putative glutamate--cysteine ligase 2 n=1 Tax=Solirubrobacter deserti TaxID=2282478 RepID=A0ABT4RG17_9ACTN|nr:YbdK family carboxylate-amine ligase [Solirubrobacter deserti]MBE2318197.1 YbdK family carboxylate-amine ligase [Solirubrobacter deserti]MDA0137478.1 YbdK family carboxylate-amine ligase [Solirubrobacter deserti]
MIAGDELRARFDAPDALGIGIEEELFLLDPETLDLLPRARELVESLDGDARFKLELPAAQLEIITPPLPDVTSAVDALAAARADLARAAEPFGRLMTAGVHPTTAEYGVVTDDARYRRTLDEYGDRARRQLVCGLHLHVSLGGADRTLAVYNALRSYLPELSALAANAPFHVGRDTGLASVRPSIAVYLQRQGVPPAIPSWDWFADALRWGQASDTIPDARRWWFELRLHATYGTLELRAPDAQSSITDVHGVAAFAHDLMHALAARFDAGEPLPVHDSWRIDENRWAAMRDGVDATFADLETGERVPVRELIRSRLPELHPATEALLEANGAIRTRAVGVEDAAAYLADAYTSAAISDASSGRAQP